MYTITFLGEVIKTSHFVQLEDGSYAEMVEGHEMVGPGEQMLVSPCSA